MYNSTAEEIHVQLRRGRFVDWSFVTSRAHIDVVDRAADAASAAAAGRTTMAPSRSAGPVVLATLLAEQTLAKLFLLQPQCLLNSYLKFVSIDCLNVNTCICIRVRFYYRGRMARCCPQCKG